VLTLGEKAREPRFCLRDRIGARHAEDVEALLARGADERVLDGGDGGGFF
jgi:hypothetical protein